MRLALIRPTDRPAEASTVTHETGFAKRARPDTYVGTGRVTVRLSRAEANELTARRCLSRARAELYRVAGGSYASDRVDASSLTMEQRLAYFGSRPFKQWVAAERACGRQVFWLKDLDKTQAAGDIFTFFFKWRADNGMFSERQNDALKKFLFETKAKHPSAITEAEMARVAGNSATDNARLVVELWKRKEAGGEGISLLDFWAGAYWPSQIGLTRAEKLEQVRQFAPTYAAKIFPGVREDNLALTRAGVNVVIVSNGDQELAQSVTPLLGIEERNAVGSHLIYDEHGVSTGVNHAYEIFDKDWGARPQAGKPLSFHYWLNANKERWDWRGLEEDRIVLAGRDGDSASSDGGMMILMNKPAAIGNFMIDTPGEPQRLERFEALARKYGWTKGQFVRLVPRAPASGAMPD